MQEQQTHIIKKASLDFTYRGKEDGFVLQNEVKLWLQQVMDELQTELDTYCSADEVMSIEQLKLDINIAEKQWKQEAKHKLLFQIKDKLQLYRSGSVVNSSYKEEKAGRHFEEEFLFYLEHGYTSWRSTALKKDKWRELTEQLFSKPETNFLQQLFQLLKQNDNALIRLKDTLPVTVGLHLFQSLFLIDVQYNRYTNDMQLLLEKLSSTQQVNKLLLKTHLKITVNRQNETYVKKAVTSLLQQLIEGSALQRKHLMEIPFQSNLFKESQSNINGKGKTVFQDAEQNHAAFTRNQLLDEAALNKHENEEQLQNRTIMEEDGIFISNAGLVLVAAFLPALFAKLNLTADNVITQTTDAVCLLNVIATGNTPVDETELVLPKLLCGLHPSQAIEVSSFQLSDAMQEEMKNMLSSVIEYWNVLGDTSVECLQESFLKRNGKLMLHKGEWIVQVEQQPYDMLLQQLPWNMTMIQLPWMKQMLKSEWFY